MDFSHRFGVGAGGSNEDPWIPPCCDDCTKTHEECEGEDPDCPRYMAYLNGEEPIVREPPEEQPMHEDRGIDDQWEREI